MKINYFESKHWDTMAEKGLDQKALEEVVNAAAEEASSHLPPLSPHLNVNVIADAYETIPETGDGGFTPNDERVMIYFDPDLPYGAESLKKRLRETAFHELNHAARSVHIPYDLKPVEALIAEGLATNFERSHAGSDAPWGDYEDDDTMRTWLIEVLALKDGIRHVDYLFNHPDGRRWVMYKTGTWLVDRVLKETDHTIQELTIMPAQSIVDLLDR